MHTVSIGDTITVDQNQESHDLAIEVANTLDNIKGQDIVLLDLSNVSSFADYFVIATGDSKVHIRALADRVRETMAKKGARIGHTEGRESTNWILLDYNSIIVHLFSRSARKYYVIEELWGDAKVIRWNDK